MVEIKKEKEIAKLFGNFWKFWKFYVLESKESVDILHHESCKRFYSNQWTFMACTHYSIQ